MINSELCYNKQTDSGLLPPLSVLSQRINFEDESIMNDKIIPLPIGTRLIDLTGEKFHRLRVIGYAGKRGKVQKKPYWVCECVCGNHTTVDSQSLKTGNTKSCGCYNADLIRERVKERGHLRPRDPRRSHELFNTWESMIARCTNPKNPGYKNYGGRGIAVDPKWVSDFWTFLKDMGERPAGCTLDRRDNFGPYNKSNCRWVDRKTQNRNTRRVVLNPDLVRKIRSMRDSGKTIREITDSLPVKCTKTAVLHAANGVTWGDVE